MGQVVIWKAFPILAQRRNQVPCSLAGPLTLVLRAREAACFPALSQRLGFSHLVHSL
jgi:hypothetical protein